MSLSLCDMLQLCLPSSHSSRLTFSLSLTLRLSLTPNIPTVSSKHVYVHVHACIVLCVCVCVCVLGMGVMFEDQFVYFILISCLFKSAVFNFSSHKMYMYA